MQQTPRWAALLACLLSFATECRGWGSERVPGPWQTVALATMQLAGSASQLAIASQWASASGSGVSQPVVVDEASCQWVIATKGSGGLDKFPVPESDSASSDSRSGWRDDFARASPAATFREVSPASMLESATDFSLLRWIGQTFRGNPAEMWANTNFASLDLHSF